LRLFNNSSLNLLFLSLFSSPVCSYQKFDFVITDTLNQITISAEYSRYFIWALLNSTVVNWYAYFFIFGKAIRTMHFDNVVTDRIPIPKISRAEQQPIESLVAQILAAKQANPAAAVNRLEAEIDALVYRLYGLTEEEIAVVEGREKDL
jgi:hypothetical protein